MWVATSGANTVSETDAATGALVATIVVGTFPEAVSSDGTRVRVTNANSNTVSEIDAATGVVVATIGVGSLPGGGSSDGTYVWVTKANSNTVSEIAGRGLQRPGRRPGAHHGTLPGLSERDRLSDPDLAHPVQPGPGPQEGTRHVDRDRLRHRGQAQRPDRVTFTKVVVVDATTITAKATVSSSATLGTALAVTATDDDAAGYGTATAKLLTIT